MTLKDSLAVGDRSRHGSTRGATLDPPFGLAAMCVSGPRSVHAPGGEAHQAVVLCFSVLDDPVRTSLCLSR